MAVKPERPRQAVILAGGRGTRLRPLTDTRPKPMIEFHGKPFLGYVVELLREQGFERILLLLGYLPEVVIDHFGGGSRYGVRIDYDITGADDLTAHRVHHARDRIDDIFLLLYCDHYWPMRFDDLWSAYRCRSPASKTGAAWSTPGTWPRCSSAASRTPLRPARCSSSRTDRPCRPPRWSAASRMGSVDAHGSCPCRSPSSEGSAASAMPSTRSYPHPSALVTSIAWWTRS